MKVSPSSWAVFALGLAGLIFCLTFLRKPPPRKKPSPPSPEAMQFHELVAAGDLAAVKTALAEGSDVNIPGHNGRTPLMTAIEHKQLDCFDFLLDQGADPELTDDFNQTALREAVNWDWLPAVERLLALGVDLGHRPKYPLKALPYHEFKLSEDFEIPPEYEVIYGTTDRKKIEKQMQESMNESNEEPHLLPVIYDAQSVPVLRLLLAKGEALSEASAELRRQLIGLPAESPIDATEKDFVRSRFPAFGKTNPELFNDPFCLAMIRSGQNAYGARQKFDYEDLSKAVWCYDRFGHSLTELPDGRWVGIAGEHEDYYDPDFCIYNDVVVHDGKGGITLYRYPKNVFPPTDFHTATLVENAIIIIGNLGYLDDRCPGVTPVYRLDLSDLSISKLTASGKGPGWISRHRAVYDPDKQSIRVTGGELWNGDDLVPFDGQATLSLRDVRWQSK